MQQVVVKEKRGKNHMATPTDFMQQVKKIGLFGAYGAAGCFVAAFLAQLLFLLLPADVATVGGSGPQAVCLTIDCSGSMDGEPLAQVKSAALKYVEQQDLFRDVIAVIGFGSGTHLGTGPTTDQSTIKAAIDNLHDGGGTNMSRALEQARNTLDSEVGTGGRNRNILLFTDGQPQSQSAALSAAKDCRNNGVRVVAIGSGGADIAYLEKLTGNKDLVFSAMGDAMDLEKAFMEADKAIRGHGSLVDQARTRGTGATYSFKRAFQRIIVWSVLIAIGLALALVAGQNHYSHRPMLSTKEAVLCVVGGLLAGVVAGTAAQLFYNVAQILPAGLAELGRIPAWAILGGLLGLGMSFFVPNLNKFRALLAGAVGGAAAAIGFLIMMRVLGDLVGRFLGAAILGLFIGLMVALVEQLAKAAWLVVHWAPKQETTMLLGSRVVTVGTSPNVDIRLPAASGAAEVAATFALVNGRIEYEDIPAGAKRALADGDSVDVGGTPISVHARKDNEPGPSPATPVAPAAPAVPAAAGTPGAQSPRTAATPPPPPAPPAGNPLELVGESGSPVRCNTRTDLGKTVWAPTGPDAQRFLDTKQCTVARSESGEWVLTPNTSAPNETLVNGKAVTEPTVLKEGDTVAVGRESKGVVKLPMRVDKA